MRRVARPLLAEPADHGSPKCADAWREGARCMTTRRSRACMAAASGTRAAGRPSRPRWRWQAARSAAPSRPPAPRRGSRRGGRPARRRRRFGGFDVDARGGQRERRDRAGARRHGRRRPGRRRRRADRARRHAEQVAARRQRHGGGVDGGRARRRRGARACRCGAISAATTPLRCRCPRSRSSAAARTPAAASTSRTSW